jgi:hypothetical protein
VDVRKLNQVSYHESIRDVLYEKAEHRDDEHTWNEKTVEETKSAQD